MALTASTQIPQSKTLAQRSQATIAALAPLFTVSANQPAISSSLTLWSAIQTAYTTALRTFALPQDPSAPLSRSDAPSLVTNAVFDTDARLFFDGPHATLFASLGPSAKACLLAQGVAGIVLFFAQLGEALEGEEGAAAVVTESLLAKELELFRGGEEREAALNGVEGSAVWERCGRKEEVVRVVGRVVDRASDEAEIWELVEGEGEGAMGLDVERPRNMGLPWGFSILPVN